MAGASSLAHSILQQIGNLADYVKISLASVLSILATLWYNRRVLRNDVKKIGLEQEDVLIRRRRLADQNIDLEANVKLLYKHDYPIEGGKRQIGKAIEPFVVGVFDLRNTGDGPVDLLAALVSGRELSPEHRSGLGRLGRDVVWTDLKRYYWNEGYDQNSSPPILRGLSTTKQVLYAPDQLIRLDPAEHEALNRVDFLENVDKLYDRGHLNLVYKTFIVVLNYPLDLLYEQFDRRRRRGGPQIVQALGTPDFHRWRAIQRALETINSLPFRLALEQCENEEQEKRGDTTTRYFAHDPLGRLASPDAWRCFLLYHWDFNTLDGYEGTAPQHGPALFGEQIREAKRQGTSLPSIESVRTYITKHSTFNVYDPTMDTSENRRAAQEYCRKELAYLVRAWEHLNAVIEHCVSHQEGFAKMVSDTPGNEYNRRWEALRAEGYLFRRSDITKRSLLRVWGARYQKRPLTQQELWALERYKMGIKYALVTLKAPGHDDPGRWQHVNIDIGSQHGHVSE